MLTKRGLRGEQFHPKVQLTDQAFHAFFLFLAALIIAAV